MRKSSHIHYAWYIALACLAISCIRAGIGFKTMGFIINPAREELGWSNTQITGLIAFRELVAGIMAPVVGRWVDQRGPRTVMIIGAVLVGLSFCLTSVAQTFWQFALTFGVIGGIGVAGLSNALVFPLIAKWFSAQRGRATGLVSSGANLGGILMSPPDHLASVYFRLALNLVRSRLPAGSHSGAARNFRPAPRTCRHGAQAVRRRPGQCECRSQND